MENPNPFRALIRSRKFWLAVVALAQTLIFQFFPQFPESVWLSINGVIAIVIAGIAIEDAADKSAAGQYLLDGELEDAATLEGR